MGQCQREIKTPALPKLATCGDVADSRHDAALRRRGRLVGAAGRTACAQGAAPGRCAGGHRGRHLGAEVAKALANLLAEALALSDGRLLGLVAEQTLLVLHLGAARLAGHVDSE